MFKNYLKIAFRNLIRHKVFSFINIFGLAVGITCCIAIALYVSDELSYDRFHTNANQIYRPRFLGRLNGHDMNAAVSSPALGPAVYRDLPEVVAYTRLFKKGSVLVQYQDRTYIEESFYWADSTTFDVFTFPFVAGNPKTALTWPNTLVITESIARKYFGNENPVGKVLKRNNRDDYIVTGVIKNIPQNSHVHPDFIASFTSLGESRDPQWMGISDNYTYLLLRKGSDITGFQKKLDEEVTEHISTQLKSLFGVSHQQFSAAGNMFKFVLQPLTSIHLNSHLEGELEANSDSMYVYIFSSIAISILLIACVNFINLTTARSERRAREVGVRKTMGSTRASLVGKFMFESMVMSILAVILAAGFIKLLLPYFNRIADKDLNFHLFGDPILLPLLLFFAVVVGCIAGSYPAFYLSSFHPIDVLRSATSNGERKSFLRSGLVIFQFAISIALFAGTIIIYTQLRYVQTKNIGFDKDETIVIKRTHEFSKRFQPFEDELKAHRGIIGLTNSDAIPGNQEGTNSCRLEDAPESRFQAIRGMFCDYDFAKTYKLGLANGRFFSTEYSTDSTAVVVNEEVEKCFNTKELVGKYLIFPSNTGFKQKYKIVGVIKNFNYRSLHEPIRPLFMLLFDHPGFIGQFITVRLAPGDHQGAISFMKKAWKKYAGDEEFNWNFLDESLQKLYAADQRTSEIAGAFSVLAIFIACLGLLGLAAFVTEQRTKEIGIRKVLGASVIEIVALLSKEFVKWVLVANVVAWPLTYYFMNKWLEDFAYRIDMSWWIFILSGGIAFVIALLTISFQAIKAAIANPVESLRYE